MVDSIIELSLQIVGGIAESVIWDFEPKSKVEKVQKQLRPFQEKGVQIRVGEVLKGGKFRYDDLLQAPFFQSEIADDSLIIWTNQDKNQSIKIEGKTISRLYTGKKGKSRVCINTNETDYLIDLTN